MVIPVNHFCVTPMMVKTRPSMRTDGRRIAGEAFLPKFVADYSNWRCLANLRIVRIYETAKKGTGAQDRVVISGDRADIREGHGPMDAHAEGPSCCPAANVCEGALSALQFGKHGIGDRDS
jgi:hypothetical protein